MNYLPDVINNAKVLITVKTYPLPSNKYEELIITAGVLEDGKWVRIYPIPFRSLPLEKKFEKYEWIQLDLVRNTSDFRPESYRPKTDASNIQILGKLGTDHNWEERKKYVLQEVSTSFEELISLAKSETKKSLATFRPMEIIDFIIEEDTRTWKEQWIANYEQYGLFDIDEKGEGILRKIINKVPYKYSYRFLCENENKPRTLMIEDWEIGALYWNCLNQVGGDETEANKLVRKKYFEEFLNRKEIYFFVGTTKKFHNVAPNPFVIIGMFYPPKHQENNIDNEKSIPLPLAEKKVSEELTAKLHSDLWTLDDRLGYSLYAKAIVEFLSHKETKPPLTVGIIAPWGQGKTTLMRLIMKGLQDKREYRDLIQQQKKNWKSITLGKLIAMLDNGTKPVVQKITNPTVWFNAWKYQTCEQLWAGLAHSIISQLVDKLPDQMEREKFWLHLQMKRIDVTAIRRDIHRLIFEKLVIWLIFYLLIGVAGIVFFLMHPQVWYIQIFSTIPFLGTIVHWLCLRQHELKKKVEGKFEKYISQPDYETKMGYFYQVEEDLRKVFDLLIDPKNPVVVFVDDLDRCTPGKVAEVVEAINMFLCSDFPNCHFIVGMDARVVATSLDVAYEKLATKLQNISTANGSMGWHFLEKFVQLPFIIPNMTDNQRFEYIGKLFTPEESDKNNIEIDTNLEQIASMLKATEVDFDMILQIAKTLSIQTIQSEKFKDLSNNIIEARAKISTDKDREIIKILNQYGQYLRNTPRAIKRFANLYRFYRFTQLSRSLQKAESASAKELGVWVTLMLRWPHIVRFIQWETEVDALRGFLPSMKAELLETSINNSGTYDSWKNKLEELKLDKIEDIKDKRLFEFLFDAVTSGTGLRRAIEVGIW
jgi:hypothetical protein